MFRLFMAIAVLVAACSQTDPAPTPTATPPPTATPAPVAAGAPVDAGSLPSPDPSRLARVKRLLSAIPQGNSTAVFIDVAGVRDSQTLLDAVPLDQLGLPSIFPTAITQLLDGVAISVNRETRASLTLLEGDADVESLLQLAGSFGLLTGGNEPQLYREHRTWSLNLLGLSLSLGEAGEDLLAVSTGSSGIGPTASEIVQNALDSLDGLAPSLAQEPGVQRLLDRLPSGFITALLGRCASLRDPVAHLDLPGCIGAAVSAGLLDGGQVVLYALVSFPDEGVAADAVKLALDQTQRQSGAAGANISVGQDEELVWLRVAIDTSDLAQQVRDLLQEAS